jgi:hypothetical protein
MGGMDSNPYASPVESDGVIIEPECEEEPRWTITLVEVLVFVALCGFVASLLFPPVTAAPRRRGIVPSPSPVVNTPATP